ncbi:hypothetical protein BDV19DRAFT_251230 [Aspergillus venezuelensis]
MVSSQSNPKMSPTSFRKRFEATWTKAEKDRLWKLRALHHHIPWDEFHALNFFPDRTESALKVSWSRIRRERGESRPRGGRSGGGGTGSRGGASSTSARVQSALRNVPPRRASVGSAAQYRLRRPMRLRQAVRDTESTDSDSGSEEPRYDDSSSDEEDVVVQETEGDRDREEEENRSQPSNSNEESAGSRIRSALVTFSLPRRRPSTRFNVATTPRARMNDRGTRGAPLRPATPRDGPSLHDPPSSTESFEPPPALESLLQARRYIEYSSTYMMQRCESLERNCRENHEHLPAEIERLKADMDSLRKTADTATRNHDYMKTLYREQLKENEALEQRLKILEAGNERLVGEIGRLSGAAASGSRDLEVESMQMADYLGFEA